MDVGWLVGGCWWGGGGGGRRRRCWQALLDKVRLRGNHPCPATFPPFPFRTMLRAARSCGAAPASWPEAAAVAASSAKEASSAARRSTAPLIGSFHISTPTRPSQAVSKAAAT